MKSEFELKVLQAYHRMLQESGSVLAKPVIKENEDKPKDELPPLDLPKSDDKPADTLPPLDLPPLDLDKKPEDEAKDGDKDWTKLVDLVKSVVDRKDELGEMTDDEVIEAFAKFVADAELLVMDDKKDEDKKEDDKKDEDTNEDDKKDEDKKDEDKKDDEKKEPVTENVTTTAELDSITDKLMELCKAGQEAKAAGDTAKEDAVRAEIKALAATLA